MCDFFNSYLSCAHRQQCLLLGTYSTVEILTRSRNSELFQLQHGYIARLQNLLKSLSNLSDFVFDTNFFEIFNRVLAANNWLKFRKNPIVGKVLLEILINLFLTLHDFHTCMELSLSIKVTE